MNRDNKYFLDIFLRYLLLFLSALPHLYIFYFIFTPLTIHAVYFLLNFFVPTSLSGIVLTLGGEIPISIVPGCVAGAAYYLLFILNLSVPNIKPLKRVSLILAAFSFFFVVNVLRIVLLSMLYFNNFAYFDLIHKFLWYFGSIIFTASIWFLEAHFFKIKGIPFHSDLKFVYKKSLFRRK